MQICSSGFARRVRGTRLASMRSCAPTCAPTKMPTYEIRRQLHAPAGRPPDPALAARLPRRHGHGSLLQEVVLRPAECHERGHLARFPVVADLSGGELGFGKRERRWDAPGETPDRGI